MALGINTQSSGGGDFLPIVKYDARSGRVTRVDRSNNGAGWVNDLVDITQNFSAVMDLANIQVGWISYVPPDFRVGPLGSDMGAKPSDKHAQGFRVLCKLSKECGGDVRDMSSTAKATVGGMSLLHDEYIKGAAGNPGMLPVVELSGVTPIVSEGGGQKTTNYAPTFRITRWVNRPADLQPKASPTAANTQAPARAAPSTGSTPVPPPQQQAKPQAAPVPAGADDFG